MAVYEKITVLNMLELISSGIALDISKNHTGIVIWENGQLSEYGFCLPEYDSSDPHAEYKMRLAFKHNLKAIVDGKHFEHCIVEDCYGGENFDTVRKLLALNTVIDELIFEGVVKVDHFYRWKEPVWLSNFRLLYKQKGCLKAKVETQGILEYLEYDFYLKNKDLSKAEKDRIFFEDKCDACGQLLSVVAYINLKVDKETKSSYKMSDVKLVYLEDEVDTYSCRDSRVREEGCILLDFEGRDIEKFILNQVQIFPNDLLCVELPVAKLGTFGVKHKLPYYDSGVGYLYFYNKKGVY